MNGESSFMSIESSSYSKHSPEWKTEMVRCVDKFRAEPLNQTITEACRSASKELKREVHPSLYNWWKGKMEGKSKPAKKNEPLPAADVGAPSALASPTIRVVVREYAFEGDHAAVMAAVAQLKKEGDVN